MPSLAELHSQLKRLLPYRWPLLPLLLACFALALAALLIPLSDPTDDADRATGSMLAANSPGTAPAEDLTGFLAISRWGAPVEEDAEPEEVDSDPAGLNPALQGIGFVGVTFMEDEYAVLLNLAAAARQAPRDDTQSELETGLVRLHAGDTLPDGRRLVAITADSLTLARADGEQERLLLFGDGGESPDELPE